MTRQEHIDDLETGALQIAEQLDIPIYSDDTNAPNSTHYFNDTDSALKYKDETGTVHASSGGSGDGDFNHTLSETLDAQDNDITNVGVLDAELQTHATEIEGDYTIPAGRGAIISQALSGTGSISGEGNITVLPETVLGNPIGEDVDAGGNAIDNVGSLNGGGPISDGNGTERQIWVSSDGTLPSEAADSDIVLTPSN